MEGKPPPRGRPENLAGYLEALSRPVFQAGMSWRVIDAKWDGIRDAFSHFDPAAVASFTEADRQRLLADPRIVRSKAKIDATIDNAQALVELAAEHGGFERYLDSHPDFESTVADLKRQFRFIGDSGAYYFLHVVDRPVPPHQEWFARARGPRRRGGRADAKRSVTEDAP